MKPGMYLQNHQRTGRFSCFSQFANCTLFLAACHSDLLHPSSIYYWFRLGGGCVLQVHHVHSAGAEFSGKASTNLRAGLTACPSLDWRNAASFGWCFDYFHKIHCLGKTTSQWWCFHTYFSKPLFGKT